MHEMELTCNRSRPKRKYLPETQRQYYRNKLNREFNQLAPNKAWVGDITYFKTNREKCYICVVIDLFSRKVLSYEISTSMTSSLVIATFLHAFIRRNNPEHLIFHTDQGTQYTSYDFVDRLKELGVEQSLSKPGCPYDNAVVESFFANLKKEKLHRYVFEDIGHLSICVKNYIYRYNSVRLHQSLQHKTPCQVEEDYNKKAVPDLGTAQFT